ncbi:MAG: porin [Thermodesulfobacteriota bacterium]
MRLCFQWSKRMFPVLAALIVAAFVFPNIAGASYKFERTLGEKQARLKFFGFSQLEARHGEGEAARTDTSDDGLRFDAQRIRLGTKYYYGKMFGKLFLDFNQSHTNKGAGLPEMIKDAFIGYRFNDSAFFRLGMIKTPHGMGYTTAGWNLDIVERNKLDKGMVLERGMGALLSGRFIGFGNENAAEPIDHDHASMVGSWFCQDCGTGLTDGTEMGHEHAGKGFGYDIGVFNPAGRSASVIRDENLQYTDVQYSLDGDEIVKDKTEIDNRVKGDALAYAARIHFDYGEPLHFEASYGVSEEAGGKGTEDFEAFDAGIDSLLGRWNVKLEYIYGTNIEGIKDENQATITATLAYLLHPKCEVVAKHYQAEADPADDTDSDLGNTYIGANFYLTDLGVDVDEIGKSARRSLQNNRIQVNYVFSSGDDGDDWTGNWGKTDDAALVQWQYKF